ncbi:uncharacterized protein TNCT_637891 [Trichonephila clavata]|uniref:Uncharacterized protein n=1 Tax=Trichonephila clavata TaxID=2740835 RepID=A0A8X6HKA3_TRICU|nr:uncharacterized protein TNCT_637891 [Trichonephila clavata]
MNPADIACRDLSPKELPTCVLRVLFSIVKKVFISTALHYTDNFSYFHTLVIESDYYQRFLLHKAMRSIFVSLLILAMMSVACRSESSSRACSTGPDGQMKCVENKDPNGSHAEAGSHSGSGGSGEFARVGSPGNVQYNKDLYRFINDSVDLSFNLISIKRQEILSGELEKPMNQVNIQVPSDETQKLTTH